MKTILLWAAAVMFVLGACSFEGRAQAEGDPDSEPVFVENEPEPDPAPVVEDASQESTSEDRSSFEL